MQNLQKCWCRIVKNVVAVIDENTYQGALSEPWKGLSQPTPSLHIACCPYQLHHRYELCVCVQNQPLSLHLTVPEGPWARALFASKCIFSVIMCCVNVNFKSFQKFFFGNILNLTSFITINSIYAAIDFLSWLFFPNREARYSFSKSTDPKLTLLRNFDGAAEVLTNLSCSPL